MRTDGALAEADLEELRLKSARQHSEEGECVEEDGGARREVSPGEGKEQTVAFRAEEDE